jgi:putative transposase
LSLSNGMAVEQTYLTTWRMVIKNRSIKKRLGFLSDRGNQYVSKQLTNAIDFYIMIIKSMSRKRNCIYNAVAESFFKTIKAEQIYGNKTISKEQMKLDMFAFIEVWHTRKRRHSTFEYKTTEEF